MGSVKGTGIEGKGMGRMGQSMGSVVRAWECGVKKIGV